MIKLEFNLDHQKSDLKLKNNLLFLMGYCLLLFVLFFKETTFEIPAILNKCFFGMGVLCLFFKIVFKDPHRITQIIFMFISFIIGVLSYWYSHDFELLLMLLCLFSAKDVNCDYIIKAHLILIGTCTAIVAVMSTVGVIPNIQFFRNGANRLAMGMTYATVFASIIFFLVLDYVVLKSNKLNIFDALLVFFTAGIVFKVTDTRSIVYLLLLIGVVVSFSVILPKITENLVFGIKYFWIFFLIFVPIITIFLSYTFDYNQKFYIELNKMLTGRLALSKEAFMNYKVTPFGQIMAFYGLGGGIHYTLENTYFYLDSLPMYVLMKYGVCSIVYYYAIQVNNLKKALYNRKLFLVLSFILISIYEFIDNKTLRLAFNPYFLLLYSDFSRKQGI